MPPRPPLCPPVPTDQVTDKTSSELSSFFKDAADNALKMAGRSSFQT